MKNDGRLGKLYDRLTPDERFRLAIEALAREDEPEVDHLRDTCPRAAYRMTELAYRDRISRSMELTVGVCLDLAPLLAQLKLVEALRRALSLACNACEDAAMLAYLKGHEAGFRRAWEAADKATGDLPPGWEGNGEDGDPVMEGDLLGIAGHFGERREGLDGSLKKLEQRIACDALTIWEAFSGFCKGELLLPPEKLVKTWFEPVLPEVENLKKLPDLPPVDPRGVQHCETELKRAWSRVERSD
jgi:hypothetical protein